MLHDTGSLYMNLRKELDCTKEEKPYPLQPTQFEDHLSFVPHTMYMLIEIVAALAHVSYM
jgi:hypothetical protein